MFKFPISRDPPEGGTSKLMAGCDYFNRIQFPISRDPPEGGTDEVRVYVYNPFCKFPISRDPPEGGT